MNFDKILLPSKLIPNVEENFVHVVIATTKIITVSCCMPRGEEQGRKGSKRGQSPAESLSKASVNNF